MTEIELAKLIAGLSPFPIAIIVIIILWRRLTALEERSRAELAAIEERSRAELTAITKDQQVYLREHIETLARISERIDE